MKIVLYLISFLYISAAFSRGGKDGEGGNSIRHSKEEVLSILTV